MAKRSENFLINLNWRKDLFEDFDGNEDFVLAGQRMVYFFLSMESIMTEENGKQVMSGNMDVDWVVKGLINQEMRMRGNTDQVDIRIAMLRAQGKNSKEISDILKLEGVKLTDGGVRKRKGWTNYYQYVTSE